jgi:glycosyltransferase involved in cell wall biosynthesis
MEHSDTSLNAIVSVIIPCYNHARYLGEAIESVLSQDYPHIEIIVIDDGSVDETKKVCDSFPAVQHVYQDNQGLSAARNAGILKSRGDFLVFLDADDWLLAHAIETNLQYLLDDPELAFVSGAYLKVVGEDRKAEEKKVVVDSQHYLHFLQGNYISMHATVMYRRWSFNEIKFDPSLKACEDYDIYLRISRVYKVHHHQKLIAAYRIHNENMSGNIGLMIDTALAALERQKPFLKTVEEKRSLVKGKRNWTNYYSGLLYVKLLKQLQQKVEMNSREVELLKKMDDCLYYKLLIKKYLNAG